jgi:hypothetical protein
MNSFVQGRLDLAAGMDSKSLFLLEKRSGTVFRIDPRSGKSSVILSGLSSPQDVAVGRDGNRILVDLDSSRTLLVIPLNADGPPASVSVGLNPGQILRGSDDRYYLVARAVHILYALDPDRYHPLDWLAVGEAFKRVSPGRDNNLWLPLEKSGQVMEVRTSPFALVKKVNLEGCDHPIRVVPLPGKGFVAGCHRTIVLNDGGVVTHTLPVPQRVAHQLRDICLLPDGIHLLAIFHHEKMLFPYNIHDLSELPPYRFPYTPVRLYLFRNWPILFVVMNDPGHDRTWLSGYPLLRPSRVPVFGSVQITSLPRNSK